MSSCRFAGVRLYVVANVGFEVNGALSISYEMVPHDVQCNEKVSRGQPRLGGSEIIIDFTRVACVWSYMTTHTTLTFKPAAVEAFERLPATIFHCLAMVSGRHAPGSRTRSAGYKGKSNWCTTTKAQLDEQAALLQVRGIAHNCFVPGEHM